MSGGAHITLWLLRTQNMAFIRRLARAKLGYPVVLCDVPNGKVMAQKAKLLTVIHDMPTPE